MAIPVLADVAKFTNVGTELIDEASKGCPEFSTLPWKSVPGYTYNTLVRTVNPVVSFREVNTGVAGTKSTYVNRTITCAVLNPRWECDKAVADACVDGAEAYIAKEEFAQLQGAIYTACKQLWQGTDNDATGFAGLAGQVDASMIVDAQGTTDSTASSVYVVAAGQVDHLAWVLGGDGQFALSETRLESIADDSGNRFTAYVADGVFWVGCQLGHSLAVARIVNLTADSGKGLTDDLIYDAFEKFPSALTPSGIYMSRRSAAQLRKSRTATNVTGAPAPLPTEVEGVPIYISEAINNTESLVAGSS